MYALIGVSFPPKVPHPLTLCRSPQSEIEDMIWEVDDDCDKCVNWPEFQAMYHRCRNDKTGMHFLSTISDFLSHSHKESYILQDTNLAGFSTWWSS